MMDPIFPRSADRRVCQSQPQTGRLAVCDTAGQAACATIWLAVALLFLVPSRASAQSTLLYNAVVHTVSGDTFTNGGVLIEGGKISVVLNGKTALKVKVHEAIDLKHQHVYPGLIAINTVLGLTEIDAVRATQDSSEVGEGFNPDVTSWVAVNPDSELLPVARANGIAYFEPIPKGGIVSGQSALLANDGWTFEQMTVKKPVALHLFWPSMDLNTTPKDRSRTPATWKSLEDQDKERRAKIRSTQEFFDDARAYAKAKAAAANHDGPEPKRIPAWEAMLPYVRGEKPLVIHADDVRQIKSAVTWARTNGFKVFIAGGRDAWKVADLLATNHVPVIFESVFDQPARDTESYDVHFTAAETLHKAGVKVVFSVGADTFGAPMSRNLPYDAAQAIAFGLPEEEALKGLTLYPAELMGVADRLGSIEAGKTATLFVCSGDIFDLRANVTRMWIAGHEVSLETRHTRLYEKYRKRPQN
jgi:imidazolonepropionase-like amidohydrolase